MTTLRSFFGVVDLRAGIVTILAMASTWLAARTGLEAEMPTTIVSIAVIFPIVFAINAAYVRREEALRAFASMKASCAALYWAHRDWPPVDTTAHRARGLRLVGEVIRSVQVYLGASRETKGDLLPQVYARCSELSDSVEELRAAGMSGSEVSRANQYVRMIVLDFELMKNIAAYRTPIPLRAYSHVFLNVFPIVFGPYFAWLGRTYYSGVGYAVAALFSVVLVALDNIQRDLEDPFDGAGEDDVRLDVADYLTSTLG